jgi:SAM-dependent methyltransferase
MTRSPEDHGARFDEKAASYDDDQESPEYRRAVELVIASVAPGPEETVLDVGTGTGAIALALAERAKQVLGRDVSKGMLDRAREKAAAEGIENAEFREGRFREPNVTEPVDVVVSNFAMHHLADEEKREAISVIAGSGPRRFVLGDVMFFGEPDPEEPFFSPEVDDPATVGTLADALTDAGFSLTGVERVHDQVGVLVADRAERAERSDTESEAGTDAVANPAGIDGETEAGTASEGPIVPDEGGTASHEE